MAYELVHTGITYPISVAVARIRHSLARHKYAAVGDALHRSSQIVVARVERNAAEARNVYNICDCLKDQTMAICVPKRACSRALKPVVLSPSRPMVCTRTPQKNSALLLNKIVQIGRRSVVYSKTCNVFGAALPLSKRRKYLGRGSGLNVLL